MLIELTTCAEFQNVSCLFIAVDHRTNKYQRSKSTLQSIIPSPFVKTYNVMEEKNRDWTQVFRKSNEFPAPPMAPVVLL